MTAPKLDARLMLRVPPDVRLSVRAVAAEIDIGMGALARALITYGLSRLSDPKLKSHIAAELAFEKQRHARAGKVGMEARWGRGN